MKYSKLKVEFDSMKQNHDYIKEKFVKEQTKVFEEIKAKHKKLKEENAYLKSKAQVFNKLTITMKD